MNGIFRISQGGNIVLRIKGDFRDHDCIVAALVGDEWQPTGMTVAEAAGSPSRAAETLLPRFAEAFFNPDAEWIIQLESR